MKKYFVTLMFVTSCAHSPNFRSDATLADLRDKYGKILAQVDVNSGHLKLMGDAVPDEVIMIFLNEIKSLTTKIQELEKAKINNAPKETEEPKISD